MVTKDNKEALIKLLAMITMVIDHLGIRWFSNGRIFRLIGRISFPIYAWYTARSVYYTAQKHTEVKHALRMFVLAVISEIPYDLFFSSTVYNPKRNNVIFTLLIGYLVCLGIHRYRFLILRVLIVIAGVFLAEGFFCSYGFIGIMLVFAFDRLQSSEHVRNSIPLRLFWITVIITIYSMYYIVLGAEPMAREQIWHTFLTYSYSQLGAFLSIPLLMLDAKRKRRLPYAFKWVYRLFYPIHLITILLLESYFLII